MLKIKFHTTFWLLALLLVLQNKLDILLFTVVAALLHEGGHAFVGYMKGYVMNEITLMPYGAVLYGAEALNKKDGVAVAIGGPAVNLLLAALTAGLWWVFPASYDYTRGFLQVNLAVFAFNLLPVYPLDGARVLLALTNKPIKLLRLLKYAGIGLSFVLFALFVASSFFKINLSLGLIAVMLFLSATSNNDKETYKHIASVTPGIKNWQQPIVKETVAVSQNLRLVQLLRQIKSHKLLTFDVYDDSNKKVQTLEEQKLVNFCANNKLTTRLKDLK